MRAIIPCAGFGTRMNMQPHLSKEMLPDPDTENHLPSAEMHIIDYSLSLCREVGLDPLIITRSEKTDLIEYIASKGHEILLITPHGEWYNTVAMSEHFWHENNVLILPDTRFEPPLKTLKKIEPGLNLGNNAVFAVHQVEDPQNWGIIHDYCIIDKPKNLTGPQYAWGLIGFKKSYGKHLFCYLEAGKRLENVGFLYLKKFKDITRGPVG